MVLIGLLVFYPRVFVRSMSYGSEFERVAKEFIYKFDWPGIWAIFILSILATCSVYLFITAFIDEKS